MAAPRHYGLRRARQLGEVRALGFALVVAGKLLEPAPGVLVLGRQGGSAAFFRLLVKETGIIHGRPNGLIWIRFRICPI